MIAPTGQRTLQELPPLGCKLSAASLGHDSDSSLAAREPKWTVANPVLSET
jgi:hypothetical protein